MTYSFMAVDIFTLDLVTLALTAVLLLLVVYNLRLRQRMKRQEKITKRLNEVVDEVLKIDESGSDYKTRDKRF